MAYDEDLANRVRELVAAEPGVVEQRMFGGLAFLTSGNMAVGSAHPGSEDRNVLTRPALGPPG